MKPLHFDVVVVGAGPAGVSAAIDLASAGLRVALLDRFVFPRVKPCAGILSVGTLRLLAYDVSPVVLHEMDRLRLSYKLGRSTMVEAKGVVAVATRRSEFDDLGYRVALSKGCQPYTVKTPLSVTQEHNQVVLSYQDMTFVSRYLVAADGSASQIRRLLNPGFRMGEAVSLEADVPISAVGSSGDPVPRADFGVIKGGVAWAFPKGDHYNVGLYASLGRYMSGVNKRNLQQYVTNVLGADAMVDVRGYPIAYAASTATLGSGRVLFVGDAAGFAYAHNGEGIYGAVLSGRLAAAAIVSSLEALNVYRDSVYRYLLRSRMSRIVGQGLYRCLPMAYLFFVELIARQMKEEGKRSSREGRG